MRPLRGRTVGDRDNAQTVRNEGERDTRDDTYSDRSTPDARSLGRFAHDLINTRFDGARSGKCFRYSNPWGGVGCRVTP